MKWIKRLLGIKSPLEKMKANLSKLQEKAFQAQRNGDLRLSGRYYHEIEMLETEIAEIMEVTSEDK